MTYTPTDEQVRNLAIFLWRRWNPNGPTWAQTNQASRDEAMEEARAVLVAVGPSIVADAWDEGWGAGYVDRHRERVGDDGHVIRNEPTPNPHREQEAR